ncbi:hypothetical protein [Actinomadura madurae]|uniref:hypothetical protein n=1 Tax=Actinomadura madurae TaxID=1993 RepID=UPI0027E30113|nr:hypothetical protein [Actinomadura madurae]
MARPGRSSRGVAPSSSPAPSTSRASSSTACPLTCASSTRRRRTSSRWAASCPCRARQALLAWARRNGALIAEDDYDGEFRYDVAPLPALYGLDPDVVIYLGTSAKILTADMGVGWLVGRPDLVAEVALRREELNDRTAVVPQDALRLLLERGDLDRYIRRMRGEYARRREVVVRALDGLSLRGDTAGLHLVVDVPGPVAGRAADEAAERGVLVETLDRHHMGPVRASGLVIGYGAAASLTELRKGCEVVRDLVG